MRIEENNSEVHKLRDKFSSKSGIICLPDIMKFNIDIGCKFIISGSNGIWEVLSHEKVAHYVNKFIRKSMLKMLLGN